MALKGRGKGKGKGKANKSVQKKGSGKGKKGATKKGSGKTGGEIPTVLYGFSDAAYVSS